MGMVICFSLSSLAHQWFMYQIETFIQIWLRILGVENYVNFMTQKQEQKGRSPSSNIEKVCLNVSEMCINILLMAYWVSSTIQSELCYNVSFIIFSASASVRCRRMQRVIRPPPQADYCRTVHLQVQGCQPESHRNAYPDWFNHWGPLLHARWCLHPTYPQSS